MMQVSFDLGKVQSVTVYAVQVTASVLLTACIDVLRFAGICILKAFGSVLLFLGTSVLFIAGRTHSIGK